jgi:hypothetical protein
MTRAFHRWKRWVVRQENLGLLLALVGRRGEGFGVTGTGGLARPCIGTFSRLVAPSPKLITARSQNCALPHLESSFALTSMIASCHAFSDGEKLTSSLRAHGTIHEARLLQGLIVLHQESSHCHSVWSRRTITTHSIRTDFYYYLNSPILYHILA